MIYSHLDVSRCWLGQQAVWATSRLQRGETKKRRRKKEVVRVQGESPYVAIYRVLPPVRELHWLLS